MTSPKHSVTATLGALALLAAAGAARRRQVKAGSSAKTSSPEPNRDRLISSSGPTLGGIKGVWIGEAAFSLPSWVERTRPIRKQDDSLYDCTVREWRNRVLDEHLGGHVFWVHAETGLTDEYRDNDYAVAVRVNNPELPVEYLRFMFDTLTRIYWWRHTYPESKTVQIQRKTKSGKPYTTSLRLNVTAERIAALPISVMRKEGRLNQLGSPAEVHLPTQSQLEYLMEQTDMREWSDSTHHTGGDPYKLQLNIKVHNADAPSDVVDRIGWEAVSEVIWGLDGEAEFSRSALQERLKENFEFVGDMEFYGRSGGHLIIRVDVPIIDDIDWDDVEVRRSLRGNRVTINPQTREEIVSAWNSIQVFLDEVEQLKEMVKDHVQNFEEWIRRDDFWEEEVARWQEDQEDHGEEP